MIEPQVQDYLQRFQDKRLAKPAHCHVCGQPGHVRWHGSYRRSLIALAAVHRLPICRLLCALCHHTFALVPSFICKFHRYAKEVMTTALRGLKTLSYEAVVDLLVNRLMGDREHTLATVTLHLWRRKFTKTHGS